MILRSAWPARCSTCHAIDGASKARCEGAIENKKSIFCAKHEALDGNGPRPASAGTPGVAVASGGVSLTGV